MIAGVLRLVLFVIDTAVAIPLVLLASCLDRQARVAYRLAQWWVWLNVRLIGVRLQVEGLEHLDPGRAYVFMSNHRSNVDVLVLVMALWDFQLRWVTKEELARIPAFGWALRATKQIIIDRANHAQAVASLRRAEDRIRDGISVVFFPEGTRGAHAMLPFKKGGFVFALETGTPIVPIGISGSERILPRGVWIPRPGGVVRLAVRPPIATEGLPPGERDALMAQVRDAIASCVEGGVAAPEVAPAPPAITPAEVSSMPASSGRAGR